MTESCLANRNQHAEALVLVGILIENNRSIEHALFHFKAKPRRQPLAMTLVIVVATLLQPTALLAAQGAEESQPSDDMEEIVVTGKMFPGSVIGDIPPENQLNRTDIASYGVSTISDLLNEISDLTQSDQGRDSTAGPRH